MYIYFLDDKRGVQTWQFNSGEVIDGKWFTLYQNRAKTIQER